MTQSQSDSTIVIRAERIIDGLGGRPKERSALHIQGSHIQGIIDAGEAYSTTVHDYPGCTVLPGLIDCHTHTNMPGNGRTGEDVNRESDETRLARARENIRIALETGCTTLCDNGAWNQTGFTLKREVQEGKIIGADVLVCGNPITIMRGHCWFMGGEVEGVDGVRQKARYFLDQGADFLKTMTTGGSTLGTKPYAAAFSSDQLEAIVEEAHNRDRYTVGHARCKAGVSMATEAGFNMIAHCVFADPDEKYRFDSNLGQLMAEKGVWDNPTLHIWRSRVLELKAKAQTQELTAKEQKQIELGERAFQERTDECSRLLGMGLRFVAGSDCGWGVYPFENAVAWEVDALVSVGLTPMQAIQAATCEAAEAIRISDQVGSLEQGKQADILVVEGNPLEDIGALRKVVQVYKAGNPVLGRAAASS